jgi:hypothetical protein
VIPQVHPQESHICEIPSAPDRIAAPDDQTTASYPQEDGEKLDLEADNRLNLDRLQHFA